MPIRINKGINQMIPIRVTFGGAVVAFDFRKLLSEDHSQLVCYRVFDKELPAELVSEFRAVMGKIAEFAEANKKFADIETLRRTLDVFEAREKVTAEMKLKYEKLLKKYKSKPILSKGVDVK